MRKSSFFKQQSNNWFRQESSMDAKTSVWKIEKEHSLKIFPHNLLLIRKGKVVILPYKLLSNLQSSTNSVLSNVLRSNYERI